MSLSGLHILLTYRCTFRCDHCFVWGSPDQQGVFTRAAVHQVLEQARNVGTIEWVFFEGGEPFLYYPILLDGVRAASALGFHVGVVTNGYWATTTDDARAWLEPLAGRLESLSASTDELHYGERLSAESRHILEACQALSIPADRIVCDLPEGVGQPARRGAVVEGGAIMYRGRATETLAAKVPPQNWESFAECPHEDLDDPGRVHLDPMGNLHLCQGLAMGNLFERPLSEIVQSYRPREHPVVGPLLRGGPAELVRRYDVPHADGYADACHLCFAARRALRTRFPAELGPDPMYGEAAT
jgi:MoaA/NifB/PqqE/SkfB family radical SAM enzyme